MRILFVILVSFGIFDQIQSISFDILQNLKVRNDSIEDNITFQRNNQNLTKEFQVKDIFGSNTIGDFVIKLNYRMKCTHASPTLFDFENDDIYFGFVYSSTYPIFAWFQNNFRFQASFNEHKQVFDGKWHKLVIFYIDGEFKLRIDCNEAIVSENDGAVIPQPIRGDKISAAVPKPYYGNHMDLNLLKIYTGDDINSSNSNSCDDIPKDRSSEFENLKEVDFLKIIFNSTEPQTINTTKEMEVRIPDAFISSDLTDYALEIVFKLKSSLQSGGFGLLNLIDGVHNIGLGLNVTDTHILVTNNLLDTLFEFEIPNKTKNFDGKWHRLIYYAKTKLLPYVRNVYFDCNDLPLSFKFKGYSFKRSWDGKETPFRSVWVNITIPKDYNENEIQLFEIKTFKLHANFDLKSNNCEDLDVMNQSE